VAAAASRHAMRHLAALRSSAYTCGVDKAHLHEAHGIFAVESEVLALSGKLPQHSW
jgi:hypothetical protein